MTDICIDINTVLQADAPGRAPRKLLISIGMAASSGARFLAVSDTAPIDLCVTQLPPAVWKALPLLEDPICIDRRDPDVLPVDDIRSAFEAFVSQIDHPQFWSAEGNADHRTLVDVFGYISEAVLPEGFPLWISSIREHRARVLDRIGHRDQERLHHLQVSGAGDTWPIGLTARDAFKNAHRLLRLLEATEELAKENEVDTTVREPAWGDWRHAWAPDDATYRAPRQGSTP
ncbi:hypothetical protein ABZ329_29490 [Streptomyces rubiginosohelvolus]|uniref:hypothetical protein n=1 Tax=Streptomyces rubiginosohelvolus TaxID=67362 RepID=UPI0033CEAA76